MVKPVWALLLLLVSGALSAQEAPSGDKKGPVLYGDGAGRLWKWEGGVKTFLSTEGRNLVLGGVGEKELWGWSLEGGKVRFFTVTLPKKKDAGASVPAPDAAKKAPPKPVPPPSPIFDKGSWPVPDRADRVGNRLLLVYGAISGHPRWEFWQAGKLVTARSYDDGRLVYALALGPKDGWVVAGRAADGSPWLEVSGKAVPSTEGWRGRLTVATWVAPDDKSPAVPVAAGWGAPGAEVPRPLFWGPEGWTQPSPEALGDTGPGGVYPILGAPGAKGVLTLAGWLAEPETGALKPWFWDGTAATTGDGAAQGQPLAFSLGGKGGAFLIVRHPSEPWFTQEDGQESKPLNGLGSDDRVVTVEPEAASGPAAPGP